MSFEDLSKASSVKLPSEIFELENNVASSYLTKDNKLVREGIKRSRVNLKISPNRDLEMTISIAAKRSLPKGTNRLREWIRHRRYVTVKSGDASIDLNINSLAKRLHIDTNEIKKAAKENKLNQLLSTKIKDVEEWLKSAGQIRSKIITGKEDFLKGFFNDTDLKLLGLDPTKQLDIEGREFFGDESVGRGEKPGSGILVYRSKSVFKGNFENGYPTQGELRFPNGDVFTGEFEMGLPHGEIEVKKTNIAGYEIWQYESGEPTGEKMKFDPSGNLIWCERAPLETTYETIETTYENEEDDQTKVTEEKAESISEENNQPKITEEKAEITGDVYTGRFFEEELHGVAMTTNSSGSAYLTLFDKGHPKARIDFSENKAWAYSDEHDWKEADFEKTLDLFKSDPYFEKMEKCVTLEAKKNGLEKELRKLNNTSNSNDPTEISTFEEQKTGIKNQILELKKEQEVLLDEIASDVLKHSIKNDNEETS